MSTAREITRTILAVRKAMIQANGPAIVSAVSCVSAIGMPYKCVQHVMALEWNAARGIMGTAMDQAMANGDHARVADLTDAMRGMRIAATTIWDSTPENSMERIIAMDLFTATRKL